jgi:hypothetical protein
MIPSPAVLGEISRHFVAEVEAFAQAQQVPLVHFQKGQRKVVKGQHHEALLQAARQRQQTDEFKDTYRSRAAVERKIAELTEHGSKQARYIGTILSLLQAQWTGAAVNLKRLFKPFHGDMNGMRTILVARG